MGLLKIAGPAGLILAAVVAPAGASQISSFVLSSGGAHATSPSYSLVGTLGQSVIATSTSASYTVESGFWHADDVSTSNVDDINPQPIPRAYELQRSTPNPFYSTTRIAFALAAHGQTTLRILDVRGRWVVTLVDALLPPGRYAVDWDGRDNRGSRVATGVYYHELRSGAFAATGKMILIR